jgi:hypothetical protein
MSKFKLARKVKKEIKKLNAEIDLKIIKGLPYKAEARRHRFLTSQFYMFNHANKMSLFKRTIQIFASFVL